MKKLTILKSIVFLLLSLLGNIELKAQCNNDYSKHPEGKREVYSLIREIDKGIEEKEYEEGFEKWKKLYEHIQNPLMFKYGERLYFGLKP